MDVDLSEYVDEYLIELEEQLERLSACLLSLEKAPDNQELIKEIFRYTHTIKGSASTMGFEEIAVVSHSFVAGRPETRKRRTSRIDASAPSLYGSGCRGNRTVNQKVVPLSS